jgi:hypothetical protein
MQVGEKPSTACILLFDRDTGRFFPHSVIEANFARRSIERAQCRAFVWFTALAIWATGFNGPKIGKTVNFRYWNAL